MNDLFLTGRKSAAVRLIAALFLLFSINQTVFAEKNPFVVSGELFFFDGNYSVTRYEHSDDARFSQRGVCKSKKSGYVFAWNQKSRHLLTINENLKVVAKKDIDCDTVFINQNYLLCQASNFEENKGFPFTLYRIKYPKFSKKISLKKMWSGNLDCFVSDCIFLENGICIAGGNQSNEKHNVYLITEKKVHKCFSMPKNGDFLRIVKAGEQETDTIFAFASGKDKSEKKAVVYSFNLSDDVDSADASCIDLSKDELFPDKAQCLFGYGFAYNGKLVLPLSIDDKISFISLDIDSKKILSVIDDATGCNFPLTPVQNGFAYVARDPLLTDSYYGIAVFDGESCKKIFSFK